MVVSLKFFLVSIGIFCICVAEASKAQEAPRICSDRPVLKFGDGYDDSSPSHLRSYVKQLQKRLRIVATDNKIDGLFGNQTLSHLRILQNAIGVHEDGVTGAETWKSLCSSRSNGCNNLHNPFPVQGHWASNGAWNPRMSFVVYKLYDCLPPYLSFIRRTASEDENDSAPVNTTVSRGSFYFFCNTYTHTNQGGHPGNGADCYFGTPGVEATGDALTAGYVLRNWVMANAGPLKVRYTVWQRRIWKVGYPYTQHYTGADGSVNMDHRDHVHIGVTSH